MVFGTRGIVTDPFNSAPANGSLPGKVALDLPEARGARDIALAVCRVAPAAPAAFDGLKFGLE